MSRFQGLGAVYRRELSAYFSSPVGWIFIVIFLLATGYLTLSPDFGRFLDLRQASLEPMFRAIPWILVVLVPAVAMRSWAEERRSGTIELLFTLPVSLEGAVLGKFLAGWTFLGLAISLTAPAIWQVARLGNPDGGLLLSGYLGCFLAAGAFLAVGLACSASTRSQVVAFILGVSACLLFLLAGTPRAQRGIGEVFGGWAEDIVASLSLIDHVAAFNRGLVGLPAISFFFVFIIGWLVIGRAVLDSTRSA